ncbi:serine threonine- kinase pim-2-like protein [Labeo rohita]|uniref:non-specific serine/threonine protein kinase n=1 Tax=Labeo rohita TaxID=84645 RepID=A0A498LY70_LABRO|nr:serine threonine- kinase pim-2-like protein [Labeo rohita]
MVLFTLLGVIALIQRERRKNNNTHSGQDGKVDQSDSDGREVDDGDPLVDSSPEEPITSHSSDDWSDNVILGDLSEWRADVLHALNGVMSKFKDDSLQTPAHVASDLSVDVPQVPVHAAVECGVNDFPNNTVCVTSDCSVDVPETICPTTDCTVDVPKTAVCVTSDCSVDVPKTVYPTTDSNVDVRKTAVCVTPDCSVDVPKTVCPTSDYTVDVPKPTVCVTSDCSVDVSETVCPTTDCTVDVRKTTVCVAPDCSVDVPKTVDPTTDYSVDVRKTTVCVTPDCSVDVPETVDPTTDYSVDFPNNTVCVTPDCSVDVPKTVDPTTDYSVDVRKTTVCVTPDCSVDVPETVYPTTDSNVDVRKTTVCVAPDCSVDVPKTVGPTANYSIDVRKTTVCVAPDCSVDVSETVCPTTDCSVDVRKTTVCVAPDCSVDVPKTDGPTANYSVDVRKTTVCVAPDCSVDAPKTVDPTTDCTVDVRKTTVCVAPDCSVDVPKATVCSVASCRVDVPQATVCATFNNEDEAPSDEFYFETNSEDGPPLAKFCAKPKSEDEAPPAKFCAKPKSKDEAPQAKFHSEPESDYESLPSEFYAEFDSVDDALVFCAEPDYNSAVPQAPVCETEDTTVSPQSNQKKNSKIIEINSESYEIGTQLGRGGFGTVYAATRLKDGLQGGFSKPIPLEVALLMRATQGPRVPEIIQLLDWEDQRDHYRMVLERPVPCQSLHHFIRSYKGDIEEGLAQIIMRQAVTAAQACCRRGVLHRDIKPDNFLITLDTFELKLIDFGCGEILTDEAYRLYAGTTEFCPPEYFMTGMYHGEPATVWSLGVLLYLILCKKFPQRGDLWKLNEHNWTKEGLSQDVHSSIYEVGIQLSARFGTVYAATRLSDDVQVAVKFVSKKNKKLLNIACYPKPVPLELALLARANEGPRVPEIIQLLDWQEESEHYVMILERVVPSEDLDWFVLSQMTEIQENMAWVIMRQVTTAAQMCCRRGVLHRDLTPESFQINPDTLELKLINFGCGEILTDAAYTSFTGAEQYCPPEYLITGEYHGKPATVWSLGIFLFTVLFGDFPAKRDLDQINNYMWAKAGLSKECCHFMSCCLQSDPRQRIELEKLNLHNWFKKKKMV